MNNNKIAYCLLATTCCLTTPTFANDADLAELLKKTQVFEGYLDKTELPNSKTLVPIPPSKNSAAFQQDLAINKQALALQNTARWKQAAIDSNLLFPKAADIYACAANVDISQKTTPTLYKLLQKTLVDIGTTPSLAKTTYQRARPFMENGQEICNLTPDEQKSYGRLYQETQADLAKDGSYPSGHSALGWGWALIMTEVVPQRQDHILLRGRTFAESRAICNVHWQSDILQGKLVGSTTVAALHSNAEFKKDLDKAKKEVVKAQRAGKTPDAAMCQRESQNLSETLRDIL